MISSNPELDCINMGIEHPRELASTRREESLRTLLLNFCTFKTNRVSLPLPRN